MQNDFVMKDGALPVGPDGAEAIIAPIEHYLHCVTPSNGYWYAILWEFLPDNASGTLFTFDTHYPDTYVESKECQEDAFPPHCLFCVHSLLFDFNSGKGTPGWALSVNPEKVVNAEKAVPSSRLWMLKKGVFDMWENEEMVRSTKYELLPHLR